MSEDKLARIRELELKGVVNLTSEELDELDILVKEQIASFPERFKVSVDNACEAIKGMLNLEVKLRIIEELGKIFFIKRDGDTLNLSKVWNGKLNTTTYNINTLMNMGKTFGYDKVIKIINEELEKD